MKNEIITFTSPKSSVSEIFKTLRTNLQFMNVEDELKSILITSTKPGEGKSWVVANLAITFAQAGKKVILVDADMRRGRQHRIFDLSNKKGLSNLLVLSVDKIENNVSSYIQKTMVDNLLIIPAGVVPPNPSELLTSRKMIDLIKILENMADIVIFDGTPTTLVTDAVILSRYVSTTMIVAAHKMAKMEDLKQTKKSIENVGGKICGVVINQVPVSKKNASKGYYYESAVTVTDKKKLLNLKMFNLKENKQEEVTQLKENILKKGVTRDKKASTTTIKSKKVDKNIDVVPTKSKKEDKENDVDIDVLLEQLTSYLSNDKKK